MLEVWETGTEEVVQKSKANVNRTWCMSVSKQIVRVGSQKPALK